MRTSDGRRRVSYGGFFNKLVIVIVATATATAISTASFAFVSSPAGAAKHLKLPPKAAGCVTSPPVTGRTTSVPIAVTHEHSATLALISVCINGKGPFPFVLDSGASSSQLDHQVVAALHLASAGKSSKVTGVSCSAANHPVKVSNWSIGPVALAGQTVGSSSIPNFGLHKAPAGLLGSDVLSRFGAVRIDYQHQKLVLPGPEGPAPVGVTNVKGSSTTTPTPADLLTGYPAPTDVPVDVVSAQGQVVVLAPVRFASFPVGVFIVDTGSSTSAVATLTASALKLTKLAQRTKVSGAACTARDEQVKSGKWKLSSTQLRPQTLTAVKLPGLSVEGVEGLLGSDQLSSFGSIVIDYAGGRLLI